MSQYIRLSHIVIFFVWALSLASLRANADDNQPRWSDPLPWNYFDFYRSILVPGRDHASLRDIGEATLHQRQCNPVSGCTPWKLVDSYNVSGKFDVDYRVVKDGFEITINLNNRHFVCDLFRPGTILTCPAPADELYLGATGKVIGVWDGLALRFKASRVIDATVPETGEGLLSLVPYKWEGQTAK